MASGVHRKGITVLHSGVKAEGDRPAANIVFVHGLWGHPQTTWETDAPRTSSSTSSSHARPHIESSSGRKNSWVQLIKSVSRSPPLQSEATFSTAMTLHPSTSKIPSGLQNTKTTSPMKKVYWPQDLLPQDIPNARIMTYGYDVDVIRALKGDRIELQSFTAHGQDLLVQLDRVVSEDEVPIIFCAHSLGGIIVKDALHKSKTDLNIDLRKVFNLTKCVIFLGTPHRGSGIAGLSQTVAEIARLSLLDIQVKLVKDLKIDSEILQRIHVDFMKMLPDGPFRVHSFQEGQPIHRGVGKVVDDVSSSFDPHPMQTVEKIDASHRDMARFRSQHDPGYIKVAGAIRHYMTMLTPKHDADRRSIASTFSARELNMRIFFSVPYARNPDFVGRENHIEEIEKTFAEPDKNQFVAIYGLGGIGKTQVAVELAYRWKDSYPRTSVIWLHASSRDRFDQSLRNVMSKMGTPEAPGTDVARVVEKQLRDETKGRWLMIVDNVDNEDVIFEKRQNEDDGTNSLELLSCLPRTNHGLILFTSRYLNIAGMLTPEAIEVGQMTEEEAINLLKKNLRKDDFDPKDVKLLFEELGYIPLAISHAAAFMRKWSVPTIAEYLRTYRECEESRVDLLQESFKQSTIWSPDIPKPVLTTWTLSFDYVRRDGDTGPLASDLLSVMSFMDRQEIPKSLLMSFRPKFRSYHYLKAFGTLKATSLISESAQETFSMHRLVQLSMRHWLKQQNSDQNFAEQAINLLADKFPDGSFKTWKDCSALVVHAETVLGLSADLTNDASMETRARLLNNVATFQRNRGQYSAAEAKFAEAVKLKTELLGTENPETLRAADSLALVMRDQAKYAAAEKLARDTLLKKEKLFGAEHPDSLNTAHIVATILGDEGQHALAEQQNRKIMESRRLLLGPDHPDTLKSASNLSLSLWERGRFEEAELLARKVLDARSKALGEEHPDTLNIAETLGFILEIQGNLLEAELLKRNILEIREHVLGDEHPDTAGSLHDMGWILHQRGHYVEAGDYYDRALAAKIKLLGEDHPKTLTTLCNFPVFYCDKGDYEKAEVASFRICRDFERIQGPEHPQTLDALGDMAVVYRHMGKLDLALEAAKTSIAGRDKVIGKDHPWTLPVVSHMGYILTLQGHTAEGEQTIRTALSGMESNLGADHFQVLTSVLQLSKNLTLARPDSASSLSEAESLARRALEARTRVLGPEHPYTYKTMHHLANVLLAQKRYDEAAAMCDRALAGLQITLGTQHPDVTTCDADYSKILKGRGGEHGLEDMTDAVMVINLGGGE